MVGRCRFGRSPSPQRACPETIFQMYGLQLGYYGAMTRVRLATALLLPLLTLTGCALFFPKYKSPQLSVVNAQLLKGDVWTQHVKLRLKVHNPNERRLPIKGLNYVIELDGQPFADGESATSFVVPAAGDAEFDTTVNVNMASTLLRYLARGGGAQSIEYHIKGKVSLSAGLWRSVQFDQHGLFTLN
jgi:LEA14-like dessication related protein